MLTTLYLLRHGETDWNKKSIFQGQTDIKLNETGLKRAQKNAEFFKKINISTIYSSDLKRAEKTASFTAEAKNLILKKEPELREIAFGRWEGLDYQEIQNKYPQEFAAWQKDPEKNPPAGGESLVEFKKRINNFFKKVIAKNQGKKILVVTHGGVIKVYLTIILAVESKNLWQFQIDNNSITKIKFYDQDPILSKLNLIK